MKDSYALEFREYRNALSPYSAGKTSQTPLLLPGEIIAEGKVSKLFILSIKQILTQRDLKKYATVFSSYGFKKGMF